MQAHLTLALLLAPCVSASPALAAPASRTLDARFTFTATVATAPPASKTLRIWVPIPSDDALQTIGAVDVSAPGPHAVNTETEHGNRMVVVDADPSRLPATVTVSFDVARRTAGESGPAQQQVDAALYLDADRLVPVSGRSAELGREVAGAKAGALEKMRAIYDHVVATMQYDYKKESPHLGEGNVPFVCDYKKGNCSDLHSYVIALARSQGIPTYLEYGFPVTGIPLASPIPITGKVGGYHCWTWFFVEGKGWLPLDASDGRRWLDSGRADIKDRLVGNLVLERSAVAVSRGRDVTLNPPQAEGPLNYFVYPYAEADGKAVDVAWSVSYELTPPDDLGEQVAQLRAIVIAQQAELDRLKGERDSAKAVAPKALMGTASGEMVSLYGQVRLDAIHDSSHLSSNAQSPFWVKSADDVNTAGAGNDQFTIHPRLTRVGLNLKAPADAVPGWTITGKAEIDFQGGGSESRPTPRARLLLAEFKHAAHSWRIGQDWDLISPLFPSPNDDTLLWNAGNLGDRRPQVRYTFDRGTGPNVGVAIGMTSAVDAKDLDVNGVRDGEDGGVPGLQARVGWKGKTNGAFGIWALRAWEEATNPVAGETDFDSSVFGIDFNAPIGKRADLRGEAWGGRNLSDVRGGIGQGINGATGRGIGSRGGWIELGVNTRPKHRIAVGYSIDDPDDGDVPANGRVKNWTGYVHNRFQLGANLEFGVNFLLWETEFQGLRSGKDRRLAAYVSRKF